MEQLSKIFDSSRRNTMVKVMRKSIAMLLICMCGCANNVSILNHNMDQLGNSKHQGKIQNSESQMKTPASLSEKVPYLIRIHEDLTEISLLSLETGRASWSATPQTLLNLRKNLNISSSMISGLHFHGKVSCSAAGLIAVSSMTNISVYDMNSPEKLSSVYAKISLANFGLLPGKEEIWDFALSPDSKQLAVVVGTISPNFEQKGELFVVDLPKLAVRKLNFSPRNRDTDMLSWYDEGESLLVLDASAFGDLSKENQRRALKLFPKENYRLSDKVRIFRGLGVSKPRQFEVLLGRTWATAPSAGYSVFNQQVGKNTFLFSEIFGAEGLNQHKITDSMPVVEISSLVAFEKDLGPALQVFDYAKKRYRFSFKTVDGSPLRAPLEVDGDMSSSFYPLYLSQ